jgi:site-specific DNA-methyltransferase (adenine-specific)/adenine-specific DNA-methyltransferase
MPTLDWIGKKAVVNHHRQVPFHLLKKREDLSCGDPNSGNLLVQADNLLALKALLPYYAGQVKCIYIDPPYNTGEENWVYNDAVNSCEIRSWLGKTVGKSFEDLSRNDKWLCMMYPRVSLLREFLSDDGGIFVSIDDNSFPFLRLLFDEIFGPSNFVASIIWQKRTSPDARLPLGPAHDYIVVYAKNISKFKPTIKKIPFSDGRLKDYKNPDNDPRGPWASVDLTGQTGHATSEQFYEIISPLGKKFRPPEGRCWAIAQKTVNELIVANRIWFGKNGHSRPRLKRFISESEGTTTWTWWPNLEVGHNQEATKELNSIVGKANVFDNPKPVRLITRILQMASEKDSLILDSFAGSGTTGHAVMAQNKEDNGSRQFILVEMDSKICNNITANRLSKVIASYGEEVGLNGGFSYCELGSPLFDETGQIKSEVTFHDLARHVFFTETGNPLPEKAEKNFPLLGIVNGIAVYLLYNGVLKDKRPDSGNVLTVPVLHSLAPHDGPKVIYGVGCRIGATRLAQEGITFHQIPYAIKVS